MVKNRIVQEFQKLDDNIINHIKLEEYIDFCIKNNKIEKIKGKTTSHHILPMAKKLPFTKFSNLKENSWNKSELSYGDHYYAHYLLTQAIDHISVLIAFSGMHMRDFRLSRISENELISTDEFNKIWENRNRKIKEHRLEIIQDDDGNKMTRAYYYSKNIKLSKSTIERMSERMSGDNNIVHKDGVVDKIRETKQKTYIDGKNLDTISAERAANTMKKEFINDKGELTTIYKENGKKISEILISNGLAKKRAQGRRERYYASPDCPRVIVYNVFDESYIEEMTLNAARKISPALDTKTRENYLGMKNTAKDKLIKKGKAHLIGLYCERIP
jgi:hypothetical protein